MQKERNGNGIKSMKMNVNVKNKRDYLYERSLSVHIKNIYLWGSLHSKIIEFLITLSALGFLEPLLLSKVEN